MNLKTFQTAEQTKKYLALFFFLGGLVLLGTSYWRSDDIQVSALELAVQESFLLEDILLASKFNNVKLNGNGEEVVPVFLLSVKSCPALVQDVADYIALFEEDKAEFSMDSPIVLVTDSDSVRTLHFAKVTGLPVAYGYSEELHQRLSTWDDTQRPHQLIFADVRQGTIFYRVTLLNLVTTTEYKRKVLANMQQAHGMLLHPTKTSGG